MNTCDACAWWIPIRMNGKFPMDSSYGECINKKVGFQHIPNDADDVIVTGGRYHTSTGPKFGCIHWESST